MAKAVRVKLDLAGKIISDGEVIGSYGYSFASCSFSFEIRGNIHHFWKREDLEYFLAENGYTIE